MNLMGKNELLDILNVDLCYQLHIQIKKHYTQRHIAYTHGHIAYTQGHIAYTHGHIAYTQGHIAYT